MSSCNCGKCGRDSTGEPRYMYRNLNGESTFTGFIQMGNDQIIWIGKNEKQRRVINPKNPKDVNFFMAAMKKYD